MYRRVLLEPSRFRYFIPPSSQPRLLCLLWGKFSITFVMQIMAYAAVLNQVQMLKKFVTLCVNPLNKPNKRCTLLNCPSLVRGPEARNPS